MKKGVDMTNGQPHYTYMLMDVSEAITALARQASL